MLVIVRPPSRGVVAERLNHSLSDANIVGSSPGEVKNEKMSKTKNDKL
jgi:hypothetical protein